MSKNHRWNYTRAENQQMGTMVCTACSRPIKSGQYRYRETEAAYLPQHRKCSEFDNQWIKLDAQKIDELNATKQYLEACLAFRKKWSTSALDDDIESSEAYITKAEEQ